METVEEGKVEEVKTEKVCYKCRTKFTYAQSDIFEDRKSFYVSCPCCKAFLVIKK